jgi:hypothetical protein
MICLTMCVPRRRSSWRASAARCRCTRTPSGTGRGSTSTGWSSSLVRAFSDLISLYFNFGLIIICDGLEESIFLGGAIAGDREVFWILFDAFFFFFFFFFFCNYELHLAKTRTLLTENSPESMGIKTERRKLMRSLKRAEKAGDAAAVCENMDFVGFFLHWFHR